MRLSRDRFEDCTHVFESHHHDYKRARAVLAKYKVPTEVALATVRYRPAKPPQYQLNGRDGPTVHGAQLDADTHPKLLGDGAFYSVMRKRLFDHLRAVHCKDGGPTTGCCVLFWATFAGWVRLQPLYTPANSRCAPCAPQQHTYAAPTPPIRPFTLAPLYPCTPHPLHPFTLAPLHPCRWAAGSSRT